MIRVFLIALLALGALVIVSRNLGGFGEAPPDIAEAGRAPAPDANPIEGRHSAWEGTLSAFRPDGTRAWARPLRLDDDRDPGAGDRSVPTAPGGGAAAARGRVRIIDGRLELSLTEPGGGSRVYLGTRSGAVVLWHRAVEPAGARESLRQEVLRLPDGDLLTIDGYRQDGGEILLIEGRCRRAARGGA